MRPSRVHTVWARSRRNEFMLTMSGLSRWAMSLRVSLGLRGYAFDSWCRIKIESKDDMRDERVLTVLMR
jgi:hypothetical protein